jgi:hypothetical protein
LIICLQYFDTLILGNLKVLNFNGIAGFGSSLMLFKNFTPEPNFNATSSAVRYSRAFVSPPCFDLSGTTKLFTLIIQIIKVIFSLFRFKPKLSRPGFAGRLINIGNIYEYYNVFSKIKPCPAKIV